MKSNNRTTVNKSRKPGRRITNYAWSIWFVPLMVAVITFAAFSPALINDFVNWDDDKILLDNPYYRGFGWEQIKWMFTTFLMGHYQPLSWLSFAVDYRLWGMNPVGYHLSNLLLHVANAVLFYVVGRRLLCAALSISNGAENWRLNVGAGLATLLFALHPLRVESVAWATERRDVLSGLFYFITIYLYLRAVEIAEPAARRRWFCATFAAYLMSLLSKATAITLPVVVLVLDFYPLRRLTGSPANLLKRASRTILYEKILFLIPAIGFSVAAFLAQQITGALKPLDQFGVVSRILQASFAFMFYLCKTLWPFGLAPIYELPIDVGGWFWLFVLSSVTAVALSVVLYLLRRRWPAALACWVYYVVVLAPVTGVAQSGPQLVADRYSYLACLGWPLLIGAGFYRLAPGRDRTPKTHRGFVATLFFALMMLGLAVLTWKQTEVWRSPITLWQHGTAVEPLASIAHYNLGRAYERENNMTEAVESYRRAVAVNPGYAKAHFNLARLLAIKGLDAEAIEHYRRVLEIHPDQADAHNDLGLLLEIKGDTAAAVAEFRKAIEFDPGHYKAFFNLAELSAKQGDLADATASYEKAVRINPNESAIHVRLAIVLARQGQLQSAENHFRRAIELNPDDADARILLARSLVAQGKKDEAERSYQEALRRMTNNGKGAGDAANNPQRSGIHEAH